MRIAVTGAEGFLGSRLVQQKGYIPLHCDVTDRDEVSQALQRTNPDVVIHCAAITDVDYCEKEENVEEVGKVNVKSIANILYWLTSGTLIYLSTDHVFDGKKSLLGYKEQNRISPVNRYGMSKAMGESVSRIGTHRNLIIRTSKLFAMETLQKDLALLRSGKSREFTNLIKRSFLHVDHFISGIEFVLDNLDRLQVTDILHLAGTKSFSYYQFWSEIGRYYQIDSELILRRDTEIEATPRPFNGGLNVTKAKRLGVPLYSANDGIRILENENSGNRS